MPWCLFRMSLKDSDVPRAALFRGSLRGEAAKPGDRPHPVPLWQHRWQITASSCHQTAIAPCLVLRLCTWGRCLASCFIMPWMTFGCLQLRDFSASLLLPQSDGTDSLTAFLRTAWALRIQRPSCHSIFIVNKHVFPGTFIVLETSYMSMTDWLL